MECRWRRLHEARGSGYSGQVLFSAVWCLDVLLVMSWLRRCGGGNTSYLRSVVASECGGVRLFRGGGGPMLRLCSGLFVGISDRDAAVGCIATSVKGGRQKQRQRWSVGKTESLVDVVVVVVGELPIRKEH
jgi:hypothetical protein